MDLTNIGLILQGIGSALLLGGYAPQIIKLHRTFISTGISLLFWAMIATGCTTILINMISQGTSLPVITTQALNAVGAWYTLALVIYSRKKQGVPLNIPRIAKWIALALVIGEIVLYNTASIETFGYVNQTIGTVALLTAYLPQIAYLYKVKDATGISRWLFIVLGSGLLLVTGNMIITGTDMTIIITEFVNIALIFVQYAMTVYYQNKNSLKNY